MPTTIGLAEEELEPAGAMGAVCRAGESVKRSSYERPYNPVLEQSCVHLENLVFLENAIEFESPVVGVELYKYTNTQLDFMHDISGPYLIQTNINNNLTSIINAGSKLIRDKECPLRLAGQN